MNQPAAHAPAMNLPAAQMLSSIAGKIQHLLLVYPNFADQFSEQEYEEVVTLFEAQGTVFRFLLLRSQGTLNFKMDQLRGPLKRGQQQQSHQATLPPQEVMRDIVDLRPVMDFPTLLHNWHEEMGGIRNRNALLYQRWAQDPFVVKTWGGACILLQPVHSQRMCYHFLPMELAAQQATGCLIQPTQLYLEGGNILRGMRHAIIGKDLWRINTQFREAVIEKDRTCEFRGSLKMSQPFDLQEFRDALGVDDVLLLGDTTLRPKYGDAITSQARSFQPLFHVDLYLSLGGWYDEGQTVELAFVASPQLAIQHLAAQKVARKTRLAEPADWEGRFDAVARQLEGEGYHVVRMPILLHDGRCYSYNNGLVEIDGNDRRITLASYQVPEKLDQQFEQLNSVFQELEAEVERIYNGHGFQVQWLKTTQGDFFRRVVREGGGLHCVTKVLRRSISTD